MSNDKFGYLGWFKEEHPEAPVLVAYALRPEQDAKFREMLDQLEPDNGDKSNMLKPSIARIDKTKLGNTVYYIDYDSLVIDELEKIIEEVLRED